MLVIYMYIPCQFRAPNIMDREHFKSQTLWMKRICSTGSILYIKLKMFFSDQADESFAFISRSGSCFNIFIEPFELCLLFHILF